MIIKHSNIFMTSCQTIVNTVNCDGYMGRGLALECKILYPDAFAEYEAACENEMLRIGELLLSTQQTPWILHFPTKNHWQRPSKMRYIEQGLQRFVQCYKDLGITSVAFPILGSQNGGLDPSDVLDVMEKYLSDLECEVEVYQHNPVLVAPYLRDLADTIERVGESTFAKHAGVQPTFVHDVWEAIERGRITSLSALLECKGVGLVKVSNIMLALKTLGANGQEALF